MALVRVISVVRRGKEEVEEEMENGGLRTEMRRYGIWQRGGESVQ
jgi:hypothetical protein